MNAHIRRTYTPASVAGEHPGLYESMTPADWSLCKALQDRMESQPRYYAEAVFGRCEWDDEEMDAEDTGTLAYDKLWSAVEDAKLRCSRLNTHAIITLIAAVTASYQLAAEQKERRQAFDDAWENMSYRRRSA